MTGKINEIALEVMQNVNAPREDHAKTMALLNALQKAIQETVKKAS